jgi:uncharacterized membrane protein YgaE (UPF0421/DUF939 family)
MQIRSYFRSIWFMIGAVVAMLLSYYCAYWFSLLIHIKQAEIGGLWGAISAAIVINTEYKSLLDAAWLRFLGSVVGVLIPLVFIYIFGYTIFAFGCSAFFTVLICNLLPWKDVYHGALITVAVVIVVGKLFYPTVPIWLNTTARLVESIVGIVVTIIVMVIFIWLQKCYRFKAK